MGAYEYTALDSNGRQRRGVLEGDTPRQVRQRLREQGLSPLSLTEVVQRESAARRGPVARAPRINATDLALVTRQLATLVRSGEPVDEAIGAVAQQTEKPRIKRLMLGVRTRVLEGHSLAAGLAEFPRVFPDLYRATVEAGEQSGHLDVVLERLADYTEVRQQQSGKVMLALIYPLLLTAVAVLVVIGLLTYVVPEVVQVFGHLGQQLPWLTRALIALSDFLQAWGLVLLLGLLLAGVAVGYLLRRPAIRRAWDRRLLRLPLLGRLVRGLNAGRFARTFSILVASGVTVVEALVVAARVLSNTVMRESVLTAAQRVREGSSINAALRREALFPPMLVHLIASGEASGELETMLERAAVNQERETETVIGAFLGLLEPLLILLMGGVVLTIVVAILLPIFDLNQLVR